MAELADALDSGSSPDKVRVLIHNWFDNNVQAGVAELADAYGSGPYAR